MYSVPLISRSTGLFEDCHGTVQIGNEVRIVGLVLAE